MGVRDAACEVLHGVWDADGLTQYTEGLQDPFKRRLKDPASLSGKYHFEVSPINQWKQMESVGLNESPCCACMMWELREGLVL